MFEWRGPGTGLLGNYLPPSDLFVSFLGYLLNRVQPSLSQSREFAPVKLRKIGVGGSTYLTHSLTHSQ